VDPISGPPADQPSLRSLGRARPGGRLRQDVQWARASHPTATVVAGGVFALTVLTLVGLWTRAGAGPALGSSNIVPSSVIAALAVVAVASTYRLEHGRRPALVRSNDLGSPAFSVSALARANAAHMAGVSHIRIIESDGVAIADRAPSFGASDDRVDAGVHSLGGPTLEHTAS
jgi:hypothetical protein